MTSLNKPITRRAIDPLPHPRKRIVVILEPGDRIAMRLEKGRTTYRADIRTVYYQMARWTADAERLRKAKERAAKRNGLK